MELADIKAKAQKMAAGGIDARTIIVDMELRLGRGLDKAEAAALMDGWRAADSARMERGRVADQRAADQAAGRPQLSEPTMSAILCSGTRKRKRPAKR